MNKNLFKLLTPGAQHLLKEMLDDYNNLLLDKAYKIARENDTNVSEISIRDLIDAKGELSLEKEDPKIKRWNRRRFMLSLMGISYIFFGIAMFFTLIPRFFFHINVQSIAPIIVILAGLFFLCVVLILDLKMVKILKRDERFATINYSFEIINVWNKIEQKGKELMDARGMSTNNTSSFMSIYEFLTHELNSKEFIDAINKIFTTRNKIVHDDMMINKDDYKYYLDLSQHIITELDDRISTSFTRMEISDNVTWIPNSAYEGFRNLKYIKIPSSVTKIGDDAFRDCASLTTIDIPNSVTVIGRNAFSRCTSLTSIEVPDSVITIGEFAFDGCTELSWIEIPYSVTEIGEGAFSDCTSLTRIIVDERNPNYRSKNGVLYSKDMSILIEVPGGKDSLEVPTGVTEIGGYAFECCTRLTSIDIPNSVTRIGTRAFSNCTHLTSIVFPNSVKVIDEWAFSHCTSITTIVIPESVKEIGYGAFFNCNGLNTLFLKHKMPIDLRASLLNLDLSKITLFVPKGTENEYRNNSFYSQFGEIKTE